jgi:hypothetical protein
VARTAEIRGLTVDDELEGAKQSQRYPGHPSYSRSGASSQYTNVVRYCSSSSLVRQPYLVTWVMVPWLVVGGGRGGVTGGLGLVPASPP